jgi:hypothetical protein
MAEIKNCEQYVVDRLQTVEMLLDQERDNHERDVVVLRKELDSTLGILADAQKLIDFLAKQFVVKTYSGGYYIDINIWEQYDKETFDRLVAELGLELPKKDEETGNA